MEFLAIVILVLGLIGAGILRKHMREAKQLRLREIIHEERVKAMQHNVTLPDVDDSSLAVTHQIGMCDIPAAIDVDRDSGLVYVTCSGSDAVGVISDTVYLGQTAVGYFPQGVVVNPVNGLAYVAVQYSHQVAVLDGLELVATIAVPGMPFALDVDRNSGRVYVACEMGDALAVIEGINLLTTIPTGRFPDAVLVQPVL